MDFTKLVLNFLYQHSIKIISLPAMISMVIFLANLVLALSDGALSEDEFHSLVSMASGSQAVILLFVMAILKIKR